MATAKVTYSDQFTQDVKLHFHWNTEIIKAVDNGSPFLGDLMFSEASAIHTQIAKWTEEISNHLATEGN